jgi:prepilin-type N-terminal cleavage/methylation domain-containing protein
MRTSCKKFGFSLTEMVVVVAILALLTGIGLPAIRSLQKSFETGSGVTATINAAFSTARAIASKEQRYAGVRFQLDIQGSQYMIFIIHDPEKTKLSSGFRALDGQKPMKLPDDFRVVDMLIQANETTGKPLNSSVYLEGVDVKDFSASSKSGYLRDISCFSVIFSPAGKLVVHDIRVRNRDGIFRPDNGESKDDIFNSLASIQNRNVGMFIQDDYEAYGYGKELSANVFYIYDKNIFDNLGKSAADSVAGQQRYNYLKSLKPVFINQYTGTIVKNK